MRDTDDQLAGTIAVADPVKAESRAEVKAMRDVGLDVVMMTGGNKRTAEAVAFSGRLSTASLVKLASSSSLAE